MNQTTEELQHELDVVRDFILLPLLLTTVENNRNNQIIMDRVQEMIIDASHEGIMYLIHEDLAKVRAEMRRLKMKIWECDHNLPYFDYRYISRGYEQRFMLLKTVAKAELSIKLGHYVDQFIKRLI